MVIKEGWNPEEWADGRLSGLELGGTATALSPLSVLWSWADGGARKRVKIDRSDQLL